MAFRGENVITGPSRNGAQGGNDHIPTKAHACPGNVKK